MPNWNSSGGNDTWKQDEEKWNDGGTSGFDEGPAAQDNGDSFDSGFGAHDTGAVHGGGGCHNCGQDGHFSRDCPEPRKQGACFNCGEEGHSKAECSKPRVFKGACKDCGVEGHQARDCPSKPQICKQCLMEGDHDTIDCKNKKIVDLSRVPDMTEAQAWSMLKQASDEKDVGDFKDAIKILSKAMPELTYPEIEKEMRRRSFKIYLIGQKRQVEAPTYTNVNLQGEVGKTYSLGLFTSPKCQRPILQAGWPTDVEDNLVRLADTGMPVDRGIPLCNNCNELGHVKRNCQQDVEIIEATKVVCALCSMEGHRVRDCTEPRRKPREPRTCNNCGSEDHISKECDQPRVVKCFNCDQEGHAARDCSAPRDWSKVTCKHCGEKGHASATRCAPGAVKLEDGVAPDADKVEETNNDIKGGNDVWKEGANTGGSCNNDWEEAADSFATPAAAAVSTW